MMPPITTPGSRLAHARAPGLVRHDRHPDVPPRWDVYRATAPDASSLFRMPANKVAQAGRKLWESRRPECESATPSRGTHGDEQRVRAAGAAAGEGLSQEPEPQ